MMCRNYIIRTLTLFLVVFAYGQTAEMEELLNQARVTVFTNPVSSEEISEHVFWNSKSDDQKVRSLYLGALAFYVSGKYDNALDLAFRSKNLAEASRLIPNSYDAELLIDRVLHRLQLNPISSMGKSFIDNRYSEGGLLVEDMVLKGEQALAHGKHDSVQIYLNRIKSIMGKGSSGYPEILYNRFLGDLAFNSNRQDSAYFYYIRALELEGEVENSFLREELYQKLSSNLLALDSIEGFRIVNELAKELNSENSKIENQAANVADKLISENLESGLTKKKNNYQYALFGMVFLTVSALVTKFFFTYRNKKELDTFHKLSAYLSSVNNEVSSSSSLLNNQKVEHEIPANKNSVMLKDSEIQILKALGKFESTNKFRKKDMSLGLLASELNTNTKYLSEVINRHKNKNFNSYINQLRIKYITEKIRKDPNYLNYKVSYLAEECGFSSHSTFTTVFKSVVGVTPIEFVNLVKEEYEVDSQ